MLSRSNREEVSLTNGLGNKTISRKKFVKCKGKAKYSSSNLEMKRSSHFFKNVVL